MIWVDHSLSPTSLSSFAHWDNAGQLAPILLMRQVGRECHTCDQEGVPSRPEVSGLLWVGGGGGVVEVAEGCLRGRLAVSFIF